MNIIEKLLGEAYPKLGSEVFADGNKTKVTVEDESEETQANA